MADATLVDAALSLFALVWSHIVDSVGEQAGEIELPSWCYLGRFCL